MYWSCSGAHNLRHNTILSSAIWIFLHLSAGLSLSRLHSWLIKEFALLGIYICIEHIKIYLCSICIGINVEMSFLSRVIESESDS